MNVIVYRLIAALGLYGFRSLCKAHPWISWTSLFKMFPASPPEGFNPGSIEMDVPVWGQLLLASTLVLIFAAAITDVDDSAAEKESEEKPQIELVRANVIAFRLSGVLGLFGLGSLCKTCALSFEAYVLGLFSACSNILQSSTSSGSPFNMLPASPADGFNPGNIEMEVPVWGQLLLASALLLTFAAAITEVEGNAEENADEGKSRVELVRVHVIAFRLAGATGLFGFGSLFKACDWISWTNLFKMFPSSPREGFSPASIEMDVPVWGQLLLASTMLLIFAAAITDADDVSEEQGDEGKSRVELVRANIIAFR